MDEFKLTKEEKITLLKIARFTLEGELKDGTIPEMKVLISENLKAKRGVFVTLKNPKEIPELRGCIGIMVGLIPLYKGVAEYALHAALDDSRFKPVTYEELKDIEIEISVLTPFTKIESLDEIEVGKHGLKIEKGFYSGVLLPQVPLEYGWDKQTYLEHLCLKAGLPPSAYKDKNTIIYKFSAIVFNEGELLKEE